MHSMAFVFVFTFAGLGIVPGVGIYLTSDKKIRKRDSPSYRSWLHEQCGVFYLGLCIFDAQ